MEQSEIVQCSTLRFGIVLELFLFRKQVAFLSVPNIATK